MNKSILFIGVCEQFPQIKIQYSTAGNIPWKKLLTMEKLSNLQTEHLWYFLAMVVPFHSIIIWNFQTSWRSGSFNALRFLEIIMTLHLSGWTGWIVNKFYLNYVSISFAPFWIFVKTWSTEEPTVCEESSANWSRLHLVQLGISLTFMEKHGGPIRDLRGTPYFTDARFKVTPFRDEGYDLFPIL